MTVLLLSLLLLALFWYDLWLWFSALLAGGPAGGASRLDRKVRKLVARLDDMFVPVTAETVRATVVILTLVGGIAGFLLPGAATEIERHAIDQAVALNREGNYEGALASLSRYDASESALAHNEMGVAYLATGNLDLAEKAFARAVALAPNYAKAQANLGTVYGLRGETAKQAFAVSRAKAVERLPLSPGELYPPAQGLFSHLPLRLFTLLVFAWAAWHLPELGLALMRRRRAARFEGQLADGLIMTANALRAGFSLLQALDLTAQKAPVPLSQEFGLILKEHRLGADLNDALLHLSERVGSVDSRIFANSVIILRETGGNLTEIFDTLAKTIQERKRVMKKIRAMTAEGETQAYFLAALPLVLGIVLYQLDPKSISLFFTTFGGWLMLLGMALMEIVGLTLMLRIVKVKV
ncbi:MAG TPA: type II secretion system F family protein [Solidesulfovibrio sp.]|jgi:pilus assembly protein TadC|nr:type II secretion system F family protein [Solidesulfovibrio sp.]